MQSVAIFPRTLALAPGGTGQFSATALGANGAIPGAAIAWSSSDPDVATVDATGRVTAVGVGTAEIRARADVVVSRRGVTVSATDFNLRVARVDFIQVAQDAAADVPLVRGKPTAVRLFPEATHPGFTDVPILVTIERAGTPVFTGQVASGPIPTTADAAAADQGVMLPLPANLDLEGASIRAMIDPGHHHAESDEWDNAYPVLGDDPPTVTTVAVPTLRIRLVAIAPLGGTPPALNQTAADNLAAFMRTIYPASTIEVTLRPASMISDHEWPDRDALSDALAELEVERLADGFNGHYYGVQAVGAIGGIVGLGYLNGRSALGTQNDVVFAHELGHNMGLGHTPGCGADGVNTSYPYPNGQIGIRGYDPRGGQAVPATAIDIMGYCPGFKWISGGYFKGILSTLRSLPPGTLRAAPVDAVPFAITARIGESGITRARMTRLDAALAVSDDHGPVLVEVLDADGSVLVARHLDARSVAGIDDRLVAGVLTVARGVAGSVTAVRITSGQHREVMPITN